MSTCDICNKVFQDSYELSKHYVVHTSNALFSCNVCNAGFIQESELKLHKDKKHKRRPYKPHQCNICEKKFESSVLLDRHYSSHIGGKPFVCKVCNISYALNSHLQRHNQVEHPPFSDETNRHWKSYSCDLCPLTFVKKINLQLHVPVHKHKGNYPCKECGESFSHELDLEEHCLKHIEEYYSMLRSIASFGCSVCYKFFPLISDLEEHKLLHKDLLAVAPLIFSNELMNDMLSDTSKSEADFILNSDINIHESNQSHGEPVIYSLASELSQKGNNIQRVSDSDKNLDINILESKQSQGEPVVYSTASSELSQQENNIQGVSDSDKSSDINILESNQSQGVPVVYSSISSELSQQENNIEKASDSDKNENNIEAFYIITENENGTFESNILDVNNCVVIIDDGLQIQNVAHDIEINESELSTYQQPAMSPEILEDGSHNIETATVTTNIPLSTVEDVEIVPAQNIEVMSSNGEVPAVRYVELSLVENTITNEGIEVSAVTKPELQDHSKSETSTNMLSEIANSTQEHIVKTLTSEDLSRLDKNKKQKKRTCNVCQKFFTKNENAAYHSYIHSVDKLFSCDVCKISFQHESTLRLHQTTHKAVNPCVYVCKECGKTFNSKYFLKIHSLCHRAEQYRCNICGTNLSTKTSLKFHLYSHDPVKPFQCEICDKGFLTKLKFERHQMFHRGETLPNTCKECGTVCRSRLLLERHLISHSGKKPYPCDLCPKGFTSKAAMEQHFLAAHTNEGKYKCNVCGKPFHIMEHCVKHMESHKRELNCECDVCGSKFSNAKNLRFHYIRQHAKKDPYDCEVCHICFKTSRELKTHKHKIHKKRN